MSDFDFEKIRDMEYDPSRGRYIGKDGSELKVTMNKDGSGYKYDYYSSTTMNNAPHEGDHIRADLSGNWTNDHHNEDKSEWSHSSGSGCYITTACMKYYQEVFDDKCDELETLRWFRDNFVSINEIEYYYAVAPTIVEQIDTLTKEQQEYIYSYIYESVVKYCVNAIKNGEYDKAYQRYKASVLTLYDQFIPEQTISYNDKKLVLV